MGRGAGRIEVRRQVQAGRERAVVECIIAERLEPVVGLADHPSFFLGGQARSASARSRSARAARSARSGSERTMARIFANWSRSPPVAVVEGVLALAEQVFALRPHFAQAIVACLPRGLYQGAAGPRGGGPPVHGGAPC